MDNETKSEVPAVNRRSRTADSRRFEARTASHRPASKFHGNVVLNAPLEVVEANEDYYLCFVTLNQQGVSMLDNVTAYEDEGFVPIRVDEHPALARKYHAYGLTDDRIESKYVTKKGMILMKVHKNDREDQLGFYHNVVNETAENIHNMKYGFREVATKNMEIQEYRPMAVNRMF